MRTGDLNSLPKQMAGSDLTPSERLILLDLALATGPDGTCFMGAPRQTKRTGLSTGHIRRLRLSLSAKGWISIENVPGRSSRITILGVRASAQGGVRAGAQVGTRPRCPFLVILPVILPPGTPNTSQITASAYSATDSEQRSSSSTASSALPLSRGVQSDCTATGAVADIGESPMAFGPAWRLQVASLRQMASGGR